MLSRPDEIKTVTKKCTNCGLKGIAESANFCPMCGARLTPPRRVPPEQFCAACGRKLLPNGTPRPDAIASRGRGRELKC